MKNKSIELRTKILKGIEISFQKLIEKKCKEDGELIFWEKGKIVHIKAKDLLK
jgi:hypothetical protein